MRKPIPDSKGETQTPEIVRRTAWPESSSRPVTTPLQMSVVYASEGPDALDAQYDGTVSGYAYAREGHPNADVLAQKIDGMESARGGLITGSGMAALSAVILGILKSGDHVVAGDQLYGRSMRILTQDAPRLGIQTTLADATDASAIEAAIRPNTRMVLVEVMSNPTLRIADMEGIAALTHDRGILFVVDNTFTTPRAFQPFEHGADIVLHSVTKLLAGHSDVTLGYVAAREGRLQDMIREATATWGLTPSPFDCWLAERGLHSFNLRYDRAEENAADLAGLLAGLPGVRRVIYPGRPDHPDHQRAQSLLHGRYGNMVSFEIEGGRKAANRLTRGAPDITFAPTLGDIGTTLSHPASSSHRALSADMQRAIGISEGFFRISVGVEEIDRLRRDFIRAIDAAVQGSGVD